MSRSDPVRLVHSPGRLLVSSALVVTLAALWLCLGARPATAAEFHSCTSKKLQNKGVFKLRASHAKCRLARQVAFGLRGGDDTPKGFSCKSGPGGNLTPFTCTRGDKIVKFSLEG